MSAIEATLVKNIVVLCRMTARLLFLIILSVSIFACNSPTNSMHDDVVQISPFKIVGISVRTTNVDGQSMTDMGQLWNRFYTEDIISLIPNKVNGDVYAVYTDYDADYRGGYTALIGCKVHALDSIPEGLIAREFKGGKYIKFVAKGKMPDAVINQWNTIWEKEAELKRKYTADFEVYGQKSQDPHNAEVGVYIATE